MPCQQPHCHDGIDRHHAVRVRPQLQWPSGWTVHQYVHARARAGPLGGRGGGRGRGRKKRGRRTGGGGARSERANGMRPCALVATATSVCPPNTYKASTSGTVCLPCPDNSTSPAGASTCSCIAGFAGPAPAGPCTSTSAVRSFCVETGCRGRGGTGASKTALTHCGRVCWGGSSAVVVFFSLPGGHVHRCWLYVLHAYVARARVRTYTGARL